MDGYWLEKVGTGWKLQDCLQISSVGGTCRFTTGQEQADGFEPKLAGTDAAACDVTQVRLMGQNANGRFYEAKCAAEGEGYIARINTEGVTQQIYPAPPPSASAAAAASPRPRRHPPRPSNRTAVPSNDAPEFAPWRFSLQRSPLHRPPRRALSSAYAYRTWNVNSVNARLPTVLAWLEAARPDVVGFQEIKCLDEKFPREAFESARLQRRDPRAEDLQRRRDALEISAQ